MGIGRRLVRALLSEAGAKVPARGRGRPRPATRLPRPQNLPQVLRALYLDQGMTRREIADELGVPEHRVRAWLTESGITPRTRGGANREDRHRVPRDDLEKLYVDERLTSAEVGNRTGVNLQTVLKSLHEQELPVRVPNDSQAEMVLLDELYDDDLVRRALRRWHIPVVRRPGLVHERFPTPTPLTHPLLRDLYLDCGLSGAQIELLTGQPSTMILGQLKKAGIPRRPPGGLSPFLRRARQRH